jgi:uncharacterized protein with HEPN domain
MYEKHIQYLKHILDECNYIVDTMKEVPSFKALMDNEDKKRGIVRSLEIIGEATKRIPADIKYKWSELDWKAIAGMRDKLIHDYAEVDYDIVWNTVTHKIPELKLHIERILQE